MDLGRLHSPDWTIRVLRPGHSSLKGRKNTGVMLKSGASLQGACQGCQEPQATRQARFFSAVENTAHNFSDGSDGIT